MSVNGFKKLMSMQVAVVLAIGLMPAVVMASDASDKNPIGDLNQKMLQQTGAKSVETEDGAKVEASDYILFNDKNEAEIKINLKSGKDKLKEKEIIDNGEIEATLPDGLVLTGSGLDCITNTSGDNGTLVYKGFKWEHSDDQMYQLTLHVKSVGKYRTSGKEVKLNQLLQGVSVRVKSKIDAKELLNKKFTLIPHCLQQFDVREQYTVQYKKDYTLLELQLLVKGKMPESLKLLNLLPAGAEIVNGSISDNGTLDQAQGALVWLFKAKGGEKEHLLHYQIKLKRGFDLKQLAQWNRNISVKLGGTWVGWVLRREQNVNIPIQEQISLMEEGSAVNSGAHQLNYEVEHKENTEHQLTFSLKGLEQWNVKYFLDVDHNGKITDKDQELNGKLMLKAHEKASLIVTAQNSQSQAVNSTNISLNAAVAGSPNAVYSAESIVGPAKQAGAADSANSASASVGNVSTTQKNSNKATSGAQTTAGTSAVSAQSTAGTSSANAQSTTVSTAANAKFGLTQLPKTGSDVPKYVWYLLGAILMAGGAVLQWRKFDRV